MTEEMQTPTEIAIATFEQIRRSFPELRMEIDRSPEFVDLEMNVPAQAGCSLAIHLNLQNEDELHLSTDDFSSEWFPCTEPRVVAQFIAAVTGLIDGSYRILRHSRAGRVVKARLQCPTETGWHTVTTYARLSILLLPIIRSKTSVLRNTAR